MIKPGSPMDCACQIPGMLAISIIIIIMKIRITLIDFNLVTRDNSPIPFGQPKTVTCQIINLNCCLLKFNNSGCNLELNWIARVKSDGYSSHSLVNDKSEQVVRNLQYSITTTATDLQNQCNLLNNVTINATFSINFFDIDPYEEVLVSCGLTTRESFKVDNTIAVVAQGELHNNLFFLPYDIDFLFQINQLFQASKSRGAQASMLWKERMQGLHVRCQYPGKASHYIHDGHWMD